MNEISKLSGPRSVDESSVRGTAVPNTVALIGVILNGVAIVFCGLMFLLASELPADRQQFQEQLAADTPEKLRLLIVGCCAALLLVVSLVLCLVGLFLPGRPRLLAVLGTATSFVLLAGIFGTLLIGVMILN